MWIEFDGQLINLGTCQSVNKFTDNRSPESPYGLAIHRHPRAFDMNFKDEELRDRVYKKILDKLRAEKIA